jgi:hypothetical protein
MHTTSSILDKTIPNNTQFLLSVNSYNFERFKQLQENDTFMLLLLLQSIWRILASLLTDTVPCSSQPRESSILGVQPIAPDQTTGGMPYGNASFAHIWFTSVIKLSNNGSHLCSSPNSSLDAIFERKLIKEDGSASNAYFVNEELMAKIFFHISCSPSATAAYSKEQKHSFLVYVNNLKAATATGKKWREQIRYCLKLLGPENKDQIKKRPHIELDPNGGRCVMQVDAAMI